MKYKVVRMPLEVWLKEKSRKDEINARLTQIQKKQIHIPFTDYFRFRTNKPMFIYDDELINAFGSKKKQRGFMSL